MTPAASLGLHSAVLVIIIVLSDIVAVLGIHGCYDSQRREYVGNSTELATCTDCECLPWPPDYGFPENYCRFVEGLDVPRCLVDNYLGVHLEDCSVPSCDVHTTCYHGDGSDYRDGGQFTEGGYQCLQWNNVQELGVNSTVFPRADLRENYCRNPNGQSQPWCYVFANGTTRQGYCAITQCTGESSSLFRQLQSQTLIWDASTTVEAVSVKLAQFSVEQCLQECADYADFKCRSVVVDTLRRRCILTDVNQFYVGLLDADRFDLYLRKDTECAVFEITEFGHTECLLPIGVEVGLIQDAQFTASSYASDDHAPWAGRLNGPFSWMPDPAELNPSAVAEARPFLQIDFLERMKVTGLIVQGGGGNYTYYGNWVEAFTVLVTHDPVGGVWDKVGVYTDTVTEFGPVLPQIFSANREPNCTQLILFNKALHTRYLRINPTKWHDQVALRVEVIGCRDNGCDNSLGMINRQIADSQLMVSSYLRPDCAAGAARLDPFHFTQSCGWQGNPFLLGDKPTMTIQLGRPYVVTSVVTQGCGEGRVMSLQVGHWNENLSGVAAPDEISRTEIIGGNSQASYLYRHILHSPVECTSLVITVLEWVYTPCLKVELVGCLSLSGCRQRLGMESGQIADHQISTARNRTGLGLSPSSATPRLHQWVNLSSGWSLGDNAAGAEWLQVDLLTLHTVTGFIVQAGRDHQYSLWLDTYRLLYAVPDPGVNNVTMETWRVYVDNKGKEMMFRGVHSPYTVSHHTLSRSFITRTIRIEPVSWRSLFPGLRAEVIGCELAARGDFCTGDTAHYRGFCLGRANTDSAHACQTVFGHRATQVVIHSAGMQDAVQSLLQNAELESYLIGLRTRSGDPTYVWVDGSGLTYSNLDIDSTQTTLNDVSCVEVAKVLSFQWQLVSCDEDSFHLRGTVCQYDLDECAGNHGCSHECLNYPGGYQCQCPTGYFLDSKTRKDCVPVCSRYNGTVSMWRQKNNWCYTDGIGHATWHDANSACMSLRAGSHLPSMDGAFWADFDRAWNLTWVARGNASLPSDEAILHLSQDSPQMRLNSSFETDCTALDLSIELERVANCNLSLPYVCVIEFATLENLDDGRSIITAETSFGYFRRWLYPPHLDLDDIRIELQFSLPENYTIRFDILYLSIPAIDDCRESFFGVYKLLASNTSLERGTFCGKDRRGVSVIGSGSDIEAVLQVSPAPTWLGDPSPVGVETLFTVVGCASNCLSNCGSSPSILLNATGSFGALNTTLDIFARCRWLISVQEGKFIRLHVREYALSNLSRLSVIYGNVPYSEIGDQDFTVNTQGGPTTWPIFIADSNEVTVYLTTAGVPESSGFWMEYDSVDAPGCSVGQWTSSCSNINPNPNSKSCDITCRYPSAYIATKGYPSSFWEPNMHTWVIRTPPGTFVQIVFEEIDISSTSQVSCVNGYIKIQDLADETDLDTIVESLCNLNKPDVPLRSTQNRIQLDLHPGSQATEMRFLALYEGLHFQPRRKVVVTSDYCDTGWFYYEKYCYQLGNSTASIRWDDARSRCKREDSELVSIRNQDEAEYVQYMLTTEWFTGRLNTYIGLTGRNQEGVFTWSDGSPMSYTDWALRLSEKEAEEEEVERFEKNSPNGGDLESCTMIKLEDFGTSSNWVDVASAARETNQYLCKKEAEDFTQPERIGDFVGHETPSPCPPNLFRCSTGECIHRIFLCDSANDCSDGSDEGDVCSAGMNYTRLKFECDEREISASYVCDFVGDCQDGLDEQYCVLPECDVTQYWCPNNGQCMDLSKRCDFTNPCLENSLSDCEVITGGFQCYSSRWIPVEHRCDSFPDCGVLHYEDEIPCRDRYLASCQTDNVIQCRSGVCVDQKHACIYDFDRYGYITGCRDVTHLRNCESFECPEMTFKCPSSYCIPIRLRCDNVFDCPNGEDEKQCDKYKCPGAYRCRNHKKCVSLDQLCDGKPDCPRYEDERGGDDKRGGDDELFCDVNCPSSCECVGLSYVCESTGWGPGAAVMISTNVRQLFLNSVVSNGATSNRDVGSTRRKRDQSLANATVMDLLFLNFRDYPFLTDLELRENGIKELTPGMFNNSHNLRTLDLSDNNIDVLSSGTFDGLSSLEHLLLSGNNLNTIEVGAFAGLTNLKVLEIRDISPIKSGEGFEDLESLEKIVASKYLYCCVKESAECLAPRDQFSDCNDLISNGVLRFFMWLLGLSALAGNALVCVLRLVKGCRVLASSTRRDVARVQTFLITNLAASDFLMGIYMITIAGADAHFRNEYAFRADGWRASLTCNMAGILAILSSEVSVFVVMLLSLDRFFKIVFPFRFGLHLTLRRVRWLVLASWVVGLLMSFLPAVVTVYFGDSYYGSSSVCLALPLVPVLPRGVGYMFLLLGINLVCFLIMLVCYIAIFVAVKRSSRKSRGESLQSAAEVRVAAKMALIVGTDFICWMPIIVLALLASFARVAIPQQVYAWIAVFVLPLNSSINPYLYTLSNFWGRCSKKKGHRRASSLMQNQSYSASPMNRTRCSDVGIDGYSHSVDFELQPMLKAVLSQLEQHRILPVVREEPSHLFLSSGGSSNGQILNSNQDTGRTPGNWSLTEHEVTGVAEDVTMALSWLHANGISGIHLNEDSIALEKANGQQRAYLKLQQSILGEEAPNQRPTDVGVELDNRALENLIGRLRNNASLDEDKKKTMPENGQQLTMSHL